MAIHADLRADGHRCESCRAGLAGGKVEKAPPRRPPGPNDLVGPANISAWRSEFRKKGGG